MKASVTTPAKTITIPPLKLSWLHLVVLVLLFLIFRNCEEKKQLEKEVANFSEVVNSPIRYTINKQGQKVASKKSLEGSKASLELLLDHLRDSTEQLKEMVSYYKQVAAAAQIESRTEITSVEIPYEIPDTDFDIPFHKQNPFYSIKGRSTNFGLFLDTLAIPNRQTIVIGDRKEGFFKREFRMDVINSNPYIQTTDMNSFVLKQKKRRLGIGVFAGYGASKEGLSPVVGIGISYNLLRL